MIDKIVFASKNKGKIREVNQLFSNLGIEILQVPEEFDVVENGKTFLDNAIIKAKAATRLCNCIALADDSGLVVDALNGEPGVHSSRYADGDQNRIAKLLNAMKNVEKGYRQARFICSMALVKPGGELIHSTMGVCEGEIDFEPQGNDGFGYDPIFYVTELGMTMAQIPLEKKNTISHRAKAFKQMFKWVEKNI
ncbi:MAG: RdgB/HAM1 family non-canonical purine NTP pyrophosphatase [Vampirovibrionia bacterium]